MQEKAEREKRVREAQIRMRADLDAQLQVLPVPVAHICTGTGRRLHWLSLPAAHDSGHSLAHSGPRATQGTRGDAGALPGPCRSNSRWLQERDQIRARQKEEELRFLEAMNTRMQRCEQVHSSAKGAAV